MSDNLFDIDISQKKKEDDLIVIRFKNEEVHQINFSKLVSQSKYIRDKYKYSEAVELIDDEFHDIEKKLNINEESIKHFIKLIEDEKATIGISHYKDIYTLSEYFCAPIITEELDKISKAKLFQDINFTLQIYQNYEKVANGFDTKLLIRIENFLRTRINECLLNPKFKELTNSTIYRILSESKCEFDHNLLLEFILESASSRFIMFKLVELDKLKDDNVYKLINFIDKQEETKQKMYLEYIPFNLSFLKNIMNKLEEVVKEKNTINDELKRTKINEKETKEELNKINKELKQTKEELNETKIKENKTKEELEAYKREKKQPKDVIKGRKSDNKQYTQSIIVGGNDNFNQLGEKPNKEGDPIISPPVKLSLDPSSLLSYSAYDEHSVLVMIDGSLKGVGYNCDGRISATLQKTKIRDFTDFCIKDGSGHQLAAVSAVCCIFDTLYMFSKSSGNERQLVLCDKDINGVPQFFLTSVIINQCHFSVVIIIQQLSVVKVKSSSSTVIQFKIHLIHQSRLFLFQTARKHPVSRSAITQSLFLAQTAECSFHQMNQTESSTFQLFQNFYVTKFSVCQAHGATSWQSARKAAFLGVDQINMVNSVVKKEQDQFHHSQRFHHFKNTKSRQPMLEMVIHFSRHAKVKSFHVVVTVMASSSSAVTNVKIVMFIHQRKRRSLAVLDSALQGVL